MRTEARYRRRRAGAVIGLGAAVALAAVGLTAGGGAKPSRRPAPARAGQSLALSARRGPRGSEAVPILMYHVILPAPAGAPFPGLYVAPSDFVAQMGALARSGYRAVTMDQVWANWHRGTPLPPGKPIVISFDNGYESQYANALPVLRRLGWVGVENLQLSGLPPSQGGLSRREVRALVHAGWELDTQGYSHADLVRLDAEQLHFQIATARALLRARYHVSAEWFCYPSGHYDATVVAAVRAAGFRGSTTVIRGWASPTEDPFRLPRLEVLAGTGPSELLGELAAIRHAPPPGPAYGVG